MSTKNKTEVLAVSNESATSDYGDVVYTFPTGAFTEVRAYINTYKGTRYAQVRVFTDGEPGKVYPTKRGIAVTLDDLPKLQEAVTALVDAVENETA